MNRTGTQNKGSEKGVDPGGKAQANRPRLVFVATSISAKTQDPSKSQPKKREVREGRGVLY